MLHVCVRSASLSLPPPLACRILAHTQCIKQLYYEGHTCKDTFREIKQKVKDVRTCISTRVSMVTMTSSCFFTDVRMSPFSSPTQVRRQVYQVFQRVWKLEVQWKGKILTCRSLYD